MNRLIGLIVHNWPLKVGAIVLATVAYSGLVITQNSRTWPGPVPIEVIHQPVDAFIVGQLPDVTNIRYFAAGGASDQLSSAAFAATIDLSNAPIDPTEAFTAQVELQGPNTINVLDYTPKQVLVRLDPVVTRTIPVTVNHGTPPEGLNVEPAEVSASSVTVTGPQSVVERAVSAEARVRIQSSGIDVDQLVDLVAVDARDEVLSPVDINPASVRVRIAVTSPVTTKSIPVTAVVMGTPGDGFEVAGTSISPAVATVTGESSVLAGLTSVQTKPVDISGATANVSQSVGLELPPGIQAVGDATFEVQVTLRASESSRSFTVGLVLTGADPDRKYTLATDSVVVTLGGGEQGLAGVDASSFTAQVNVAGLGEGSHDVAVRVATPAGLKLLSVSPPQVTVFVGPQATPPPTPTPTPSPTLEPSPTFPPVPQGEASSSPAEGSPQPSTSP